jgi:uncharacterized protein (DUF3084 family)
MVAAKAHALTAQQEVQTLQGQVTDLTGEVNHLHETHADFGHTVRQLMAQFTQLQAAVLMMNQQAAAAEGQSQPIIPVLHGVDVELHEEWLMLQQ